MKRLGVIGIILIIVYSAYYDLTTGTLPDNHTQAAELDDVTEQSQDPDSTSTLIEPFQKVIVEPGQTVLSIVEHLHEGPISASIQEIVYDFQQLNNGTKPEEMKIGETYLFPLYQ